MRRMFFTVLAALLLAQPSQALIVGQTVPAGAPGAILYDNSNSNVGASTDSVTVSITIGNNSNRLLVVGFGWEDSTPPGSAISSVTFAGNAMTQIDVQGYSDGSNYASLYYALQSDVPVGSGDVVVTLNETVAGLSVGAISVYGAKQQSPEANVSAVLYPGTSTDITDDIVTLTDGAWVFDVAIVQSTSRTLTANSGQTERYNLTAAMKTAGSDIEISSATTYTSSWTITGGASQWVTILAAFAPE